MTYRVYKFPLGRGPVQMPKGARILHVAQQAGESCAWAIVDDTAPMVPRRLVTYGTGWTMPAEPGKYLGTVHDGPYVWHIFDEGEVPTQQPG